MWNNNIYSSYEVHYNFLISDNNKKKTKTKHISQESTDDPEAKLLMGNLGTASKTKSWACLGLAVAIIIIVVCGKKAFLKRIFCVIALGGLHIAHLFVCLQSVPATDNKQRTGKKSISFDT